MPSISACASPSSAADATMMASIVGNANTVTGSPWAVVLIPLSPDRPLGRVIGSLAALCHSEP
jgi:hypothetical protein